jgi:hypothetical protein
MRYLIFFAWIFLIACHNSVSIKIPNDKISPGFSKQLTNLFKTGKHHATLTYNKELDEIQKKLFEKFLDIMAGNEKVSKEFDKVSEHPKLIRYDSKLGLNNKELQTLSSIFTKETSTTEGSVSISLNEIEISFKGSGQLSILDSLTIISKDTSVLFKETKLKYYKPDSSLFKNEFIPSGEYFQYIVPFDQASNGLLKLLPIGSRYILYMARLGKSGKTYIYIEINEPRDIDQPFNPFYSIILD